MSEPCYYYEYWGVFRPEDPPPLVLEEGGGGESWSDPEFFYLLHGDEEGWRQVGPGHWVRDAWTRFPKAEYAFIAHPWLLPTGQDVGYDYGVYQRFSDGAIYIRRVVHTTPPGETEYKSEMLLRVDTLDEMMWLMCDDAAGKFDENMREGLELEPVTHSEKYDFPDELHDAWEGIIDELEGR